MPINGNEILNGMMEKAIQCMEQAKQCKDVNELIELAKTNGVEMTREEAEAFMAMLADVKRNGENLK